jgi:hypothetical protein
MPSLYFSCTAGLGRSTSLVEFGVHYPSQKTKVHPRSMLSWSVCLGSAGQTGHRNQGGLFKTMPVFLTN